MPLILFGDGMFQKDNNRLKRIPTGFTGRLHEQSKSRRSGRVCTAEFVEYTALAWMAEMAETKSIGRCHVNHGVRIVEKEENIFNEC